MRIDDNALKNILVKNAYVTPEDMEKAETFAHTHHASPLEYLFSEGLVTRDLVGQAVAESLGVAYADLNSNQPSKKQVLEIPEDIAKNFRVVLFSKQRDSVVVATDDPTQASMREALAAMFGGAAVTIVYSLSEDVDAAFMHYRKPLETRFSKIIEEKKRIAPEILGEIFEDALTHRASDIHFEPQRDDIAVRFRVDGVLHEAGRIPRPVYENILNRVKVQSNLRIDEHFAAQDGSMRYEKEGRVLDLRTSIAPTIEGEKIVLRLLTSYVQGLTLGELGLSAQHQGMLEAETQKPFGMILVTGPTGSGKTTTLYALLKLLNNPDVNITTIEDPVEYRMTGVNQIQVNLQTNLTFATGLRSIVRQDPDIILVGEIRDRETAEIAVNAALTGHLMLSTFHANDAATAIPRLLDMGVEPFLLSSTLDVVVSQRLVRKICENCRRSVDIERDVLARSFPRAHAHFDEPRITLYEGKGCPLCKSTGFRGRTAVFEIIRITPKLQDLILRNPSAQQVWDCARSQGSASMFEDGIEKVRNGVTTLEELLRVAEPPENSGQ